jgi:hypothetical protein
MTEEEELRVHEGPGVNEVSVRAGSPPQCAPHTLPMTRELLALFRA